MDNFYISIFVYILESREKHPHSSISSKVSADLYIDDKAYPNNITGIDWTLLSRELLKEEGMQYV